MNKLSELQEMIQGTSKVHPDKKARWEAMKAIAWRLRGLNGEYVGLNSHAQCSFVPESRALVFDGRDNEEIKLAVYQSALGPLIVEILPQTK
jgi:hypothetical protein